MNGKLLHNNEERIEKRTFNQTRYIYYHNSTTRLTDGTELLASGM